MECRCCLCLYVVDDFYFYSGATHPFGLLKLFRRPLIGLFGMVVQCGYNSLLVVIELYDSVLFFIACIDFAVVG